MKTIENTIPLIDVIIAQWKKDSKINESLLVEKSSQVPQLHSEYLEVLTLYKKYLIELKRDFTTFKFEAEEFYSNNTISEYYQNTKFPRKIIKGDVEKWVKVDTRVAECADKIQYCIDAIDTLNDIIRAINNMSFNIKNNIEALKFYNGIN